MKPAKKISLLVILLISFACSNTSSDDIRTLAELYTDVMITREVYSGDPDSLKIKVKEVFSEYNITEEEYNDAINAIEPDTEIWKEFFKITEARLDSLRTNYFN